MFKDVGGSFGGMFQQHNRNPIDSKQHVLAHFVHFGKCNADETMDSHPPRPQWDIEHG
jgi:hypothetical protein